MMWVCASVITKTHLAARRKSHYSSWSKVGKNIIHHTIWVWSPNRFNTLKKSCFFLLFFLTSSAVPIRRDVVYFVWNSKALNLWYSLQRLEGQCFTLLHILFTVTPVAWKTIDATWVMAMGLWETEKLDCENLA